MATFGVNLPHQHSIQVKTIPTEEKLKPERAIPQALHHRKSILVPSSKSNSAGGTSKPCSALVGSSTGAGTGRRRASSERNLS